MHLTRPALAEASSEGTAFSLVRGEGADGCITAEDLEQEVTKRLARDPFTRPIRQHIECLVTLEGSSFVARLYERDLEGRRLGDRQLTATTSNCRELDDALALSVALLIDPEYLTLAPTGGDKTSRNQNPRADFAKPTDQGSLSTSEQLESRVTLIAPTGYVVPHSRSGVDDNRLVMGIGGSVGLLPSLAPEFTLSLERRLLRGWFGQISVLYAPERSVQDLTPTVGFGLTALRLAGCVESSDAMAVFGCMGMAGGAIHSVVYAPRPVAPGDRGWAAAYVDAGFRSAFGPLLVEMRGHLLVPLVHWEFNLIDGTEVYRQAWVSPGVTLGLGVHFP